MADNQTQKRALEKIKILSNFKKMTVTLNKEDDKLNELESRGKDKEQIDEIKQKLNI